MIHRICDRICSFFFFFLLVEEGGEEHEDDADDHGLVIDEIEVGKGQHARLVGVGPPLNRHHRVVHADERRQPPGEPLRGRKKREKEKREKNTEKGNN